MSNKHENDGDVGRETMGAVGRPTWAVRAMLALIPLAVLVGTGHQMLQLRAEERWWEFAEELGRAPLPETRHTIDAGVEGAFAPVYTAIPSLLDWHYSFRGQYTELGLILLGRLEREVESRLFGALEEDISLVADDVGRVMQEEVLAEIERWFGRETIVLPLRMGGGPGGAMETLFEDAKRHFTVSIGPTAVGASMAGLGTSIGVKTLATGVAERLAGGALLRAAGPAIGRAAGFLVAVVAGVGIDIALRKLDELRNREELEQALIGLVDEEKERVRSALSGAVDEAKATALGEFVPFQLR